MNTTRSTPTADTILREFEQAWRDDTPVFGCCRKAVGVAVRLDLLEIATYDATARVQELRRGVEEELPGHLEAHRCCAGHLADLAFDLPSLVIPVEADETV